MPSRFTAPFMLVAGIALSAGSPVRAQEIVATLAGQPGVSGTQSGAAAQASFTDPAGLVEA